MRLTFLFKESTFEDFVKTFYEAKALELKVKYLQSLSLTILLDQNFISDSYISIIHRICLYIHLFSFENLSIKVNHLTLLTISWIGLKILLKDSKYRYINYWKNLKCYIVEDISVFENFKLLFAKERKDLINKLTLNVKSDNSFYYQFIGINGEWKLAAIFKEKNQIFDAVLGELINLKLITFDINKPLPRFPINEVINKIITSDNNFKLKLSPMSIEDSNDLADFKNQAKLGFILITSVGFFIITLLNNNLLVYPMATTFSLDSLLNQFNYNTVSVPLIEKIGETNKNKQQEVIDNIKENYYESYKH